MGFKGRNAVSYEGASFGSMLPSKEVGFPMEVLLMAFDCASPRGSPLLAKKSNYEIRHLLMASSSPRS